MTTRSHKHRAGDWAASLSLLTIAVWFLVLLCAGCSSPVAPRTEFTSALGCRHGFVQDSLGLHEQCTLVPVVAR